MTTVDIPVTIPLDMVNEFKAYLESKYMVQADSQWRVTPKEQGNKAADKIDIVIHKLTTTGTIIQSYVVAHKYLKDEQRYVLLVQIQGQQFPCWYSEEEAQKSVGDAQILKYFKTANGTWMGREPIDLYLLHRKAREQAREQASRVELRDYDNIPPPPPYMPPRSDAERNARLNSYINRKERTHDFTHSLIGDEI